MDRAGHRGWRELLPLLAVIAAVILVALGFGHGVWAANLHNALFALAFTAVGAYIAAQRPGHREAALFLATGIVEAVMFLGRQVGHRPSSPGDRWWGWIGTWPLAIALALTTLAVICFPDGRLPSRRWRPVAAGVVGVASLCGLLSALWPVEYSSSGVVTRHPFATETPQLADQLWTVLAHPAYAAFQLLWLVALVLRWRSADPRTRRQLLWLVGAAALSVTALAGGLVISGTHVPGVLTATLLPVAAGWAIVHERHATAYTALSWLTRAAATPEDLPTGLATTAAEALSAPGATLWIGSRDALHAIGVHPPTDANVAPATLDGLRAAGGEVRAVVRGDEVVGALGVLPRRAGALSLAERRLLDDLAAQARWVVEHVSLVGIVARERAAGHLAHLTSRENDVLELMARGLTNRAICDELHLSIKTVEPTVSAIFHKLELHADPASNRRVLAVLAFLRARQDGDGVASTTAAGRGS